ncbi:TolC family protein [bacterium]|nr:TolC family protein [bacterium]
MTKWLALSLVSLLLIPGQVLAEPLGATVVARAGGQEVLDLSGCVRLCLDANDGLKAERLRIAEIKGQMDQALATGLPTLDLVGDWSRSRNPAMALDSSFGGGGDAFGVPEGADPWFSDWLGGFGSLIPAPEDVPSQTFWTTSLNMNWTINPMKIMGAVGAAKLGIRQQELAVLSAEHKTVESTLTAYFSIIKSADKILAVQSQLKSQGELLEIMKMRYNLGMATRLDTLQATVTLANLYPQLSIAKAGLENDGSRLNVLMGRSAYAPLQISNQQKIESYSLDLDAALIIAQQRPDLEATALFVDILERNRQAQGSENLPYLTLGGAYGYMGRTADSLFDGGHDNWRASVALTVPIFDGMLNRGLVKETKARIRRTEAELTGRRLDVQVEVMETIANLNMAQSVLDAAKMNLVRGQDVLDESLLMLQLGKINYLDVLVSEANRSQAQSIVIDARYQVLVLTAALKRSLGFSPLSPLTSIPGLVMEVTP